MYPDELDPGREFPGSSPAFHVYQELVVKEAENLSKDEVLPLVKSLVSKAHFTGWSIC